MSKPRFSIIPAGAVTDRSLEPRDLQVLCLLGRHTDKAGWCVRSQVKMAQEIACSRASLQNSLDRLDTAGWIDKKRRDVEVEEAGKHPSRSYAYRVLLDRDDYAFESATNGRDDDDSDSYAENASEEGGCQQDGTLTVPADGHPGAIPCDGTRANTYDGTKNVPSERTPIERERDARARDRNARFLVAFEARWPTAAADDRQRTAYAAEALTEDEQQAALGGIAGFLDNLKRHHRRNVPAGWRYLEEKRWTLLEQPAEQAGLSSYPRDSAEANAIKVLFDLAGALDFFVKYVRKGDQVYYRHLVTPQLLKLAEAKLRDEWPIATRNQAGSWNSLLDKYPTVERRKRLIEGDPVPFEWAPKSDGTLSPATGPPDTLMSEDDYANLK
jgi:hypothetical protein